MSYLVASQILTWIALLAQTLVIVALARQVGVLHERIAPAGALAINGKLKAGDAAPELSGVSLSGEMVTLGGAAQRSRLIFFLSPDCPVCKTLLPALRTAAVGERDWLDVILVSDGEEAPHKAFVAAQGLGAFPYIVSELIGRSFGVGKLPYGVLIDTGGRITSMGLVNSREHLDSLFEAKRHGVATIQEYLSKRAG